MAELAPRGGEAAHALLSDRRVVPERQSDVIVEAVERGCDRARRDTDAVPPRDLCEGERTAVRQADPQAQAARRSAPGPPLEVREQLLHPVELGPHLAS